MKRKKPLTQKQKSVREIAKKAERKAKRWLESNGFTVAYWHKGKASNKPYDIICYKGRDGYVIDVKTGKNPSVSLYNFNTLLNKSIEEIRSDTHNKHLKPINRIGYIFVINNECYLLEYNRQKYIAKVAVRHRKR